MALYRPEVIKMGKANTTDANAGQTAGPDKGTKLPRRK
jgi:hypothetical protein